jgi:hypothetical protein
MINWALGESATLHLQAPLFIKSCSRSASLLLRPGIDFNFAVVILTPFKPFFYYVFGHAVTITGLDVKP